MWRQSATWFFNEHRRTIRAAAAHDEAVRAMATVHLSPGLAAATIVECVIEALSGSGAALAPATVALQIPLTLVASLPCFERFQPSAEDGSVLLLAFASESEVEQAIGLAAWHAPTRTDHARTLKVSLPPAAAAAAEVFERTMVRGMNSTSPSRLRDASFLRYDLEAKTMTLRLSIRAGAAVGAPPAEPGRWMYSALQARWVRRAAPVAPPKTLLTEPHVCEGVLAAYCL